MSGPDLVAFSQRLRELRRTAGLSVKELANRAEISASYLRVLENGKNSKSGKPSRPSRRFVTNLMRALGSDAADLAWLAGYGDLRAADQVDTDRSDSVVDDRSAVDRLQIALTSLGRRTDLIRTLGVDRLRKFIVDFEEIAAGTAECPNEEEFYTREAVGLARSQLRAVSFEDLAWWTSGPGALYQEDHRRALRANPQLAVTRIFLTTLEERDQLEATFQWHQELGIQAYWLDLTAAGESEHEDFVVYDEVLLRVARGGPTVKSATFTEDVRQIRAKLETFESLRRRAERLGIVVH